ncbi:MBL fold metallo-hydrolase [Salinisphaera sp. T31B1]|uniref:MBL fold metallo-hydrolase n=1 Tax=Salinisphaera sp. T31B1 TaxID=727963 RepID=UPI003340053C
MSDLTGQRCELAPGIVRVTAPNPSPMTGPGTNSYVLGSGPCVIVDPGVDDADHLAALRAAAPGVIAAIVITHRHPDHVGGAARLAESTGAPIRAFGHHNHGAYDAPLIVDEPLNDGDAIALGGMTLDVLHTPGHAADHLCLYAREARWLFAGDTVMADVTVVILPPDGSMSAYLDSLARLRAMDIDTIAPAHGHLLDDPAAVLAHIVGHRLDREDQVRRALARGPTTARAIAAVLYPDIDPRLAGMAATQVEAHLIRLAEHGEAVADDHGWRRTA